MHSFPPWCLCVRVKTAATKTGQDGAGMADSGQRHTGLVRALSGTLVIAAGVVPIIVNYSYLSSNAGDDRMIAWTAAGCGLLGVLMGLWILLARRTGGKPLVVTRRKWRYGASIIMVVLGSGLIVAALTASQPQMVTGVPALFIGSSMLQLFVPEGTELGHVSLMT